jgi:septal ring factor EnvC (AmiA/AmiB activator)
MKEHMAQKKKSMALMVQIIGVILLIALAGGCLYLVRVNKGQKDMIARLTVKEEQLHKKYADQRHQAEEYLRMKSAVEGKQRSSQSDLDKAAKEEEALKAEFNAYKAKQTSSLNQLTLERDKLKKDLDDLKKTHAQLASDSQKEQALLSDAKKDLEKKVTQNQKELDRCVKANTELTSISKELLIKYKNKGVVSALAAKEPLTQVKKVELEEFIQEYSDKVDKLKFEKQN